MESNKFRFVKALTGIAALRAAFIHVTATVAVAKIAGWPTALGGLRNAPFARVFFRLLVVLLCAMSVVGQANARDLVLIVNGRSPSRVPSLLDGERVMVGVENVAAGLGVPARKANNAVLLSIEGEQVTLTQGDVVVHQGTADVMHLSTSPKTRSGKMYIDVADLPELFDVDMDLEGTQLALTSSDHGHSSTNRVPGAPAGTDSGGFQAKEIPKPSPSPTPQNSSDPSQTGGSGKTKIGHAAVDMMDSAGSRSYSMALDASGNKASANIYANKSGGQNTNVGGTVRFGPGEKHVAVGSITDPLQGIAFVGGNDSGVEIENASGVMLSSALRHIDLLNVTSVSRQRGSFLEQIAFLSRQGKLEQALLGFRKTSALRIGTFGREIWLGQDGIAGGLSLQTSGRVFADAALGFAGAGLPLNQGDAPARLNGGYRFSQNVSFIESLTSGFKRFGTGTAGLIAQRHNAQLSLTRANTATGFDLSLSDANRNGELSILEGPGQSSVNTKAALPAGQGMLNLLAMFASHGSADDAATFQFKRQGASPILGLERVASSGTARFGPVLGIALPISGLLSAGVELHPLSTGYGLRVSLDQTLQVSNQPRFILIKLDVIGTSASPLFVYLDGVKNQPLPTDGASLKLPRGSHYLSVQSADNTLATPAVRISDAGPKTISLNLWPFRTVGGRVTVEGATAVNGAQTPLGGITLILKPGNYVAQTDDAGSFEFPPVALDPSTTIEADPDTVPDGLAAGASQPLPAEGSALVFLRPSKKLEKVTF